MCLFIFSPVLWKLALTQFWVVLVKLIPRLVSGVLTLHTQSPRFCPQFHIKPGMYVPVVPPSLAVYEFKTSWNYTKPCLNG